MFVFKKSQEDRKKKYYQNAIVVSLGSDNIVIFPILCSYEVNKSYMRMSLLIVVKAIEEWVRELDMQSLQDIVLVSGYL